MPYLAPNRRLEIDEWSATPSTPGELNYVITRQTHDYLRLKGLSYANINEVVGVLECAKQEFYRRIVAPYEDEKMRENGDIA